MIVSRKKIYIITLFLYLFCLPFGAMNIGNFGSLLKIIAILPIGISFYGLKFKSNKLIKFQAIFTFWAIASIIWSVYKNSSISRVISYVELFALLISVTAFDFDDKDISIIKLALVWSSRFTAVLLLIYGEFIEGRLSFDGILSEDPNYICAYFSFGVIFALQKIVESNNLKKKIFGGLELLIYIYIIFMTGSRGGLIGIAASITAYLLIFIGKSNIKKSIGIICLFITIVIFCISFIDYLPIELRSRFSINDVVSTGGTGRMEIWKSGVDLYLNSSVFRWIFGYGTATTNYCFILLGYSINHVMHNIFLEILVEMGLIGFILYLINILVFVKETLKFNDRFCFSILICMIAMSISLSLSIFKPYYNIMLFIIMNSVKTKDNNMN